MHAFLFVMLNAFRDRIKLRMFLFRIDSQSYNKRLYNVPLLYSHSLNSLKLLVIIINDVQCTADTHYYFYNILWYEFSFF